MSILQDNSNYFNTVTPTGRDIQGIVPVKKYYVLNQPFKQAINAMVLEIPILYRENIRDHSNQFVYLQFVRTGGGLIQPFIKNSTNYDVSYIAILNQQYNNTIQDKQYLQRDTDYTTVAKDTTAKGSFMVLNSFGTSTDNSNGGNDKGNFNINLKINNHNLNIIGNWYTPLVKNITSQDNDAVNGWVSIETVDNYLNLV